MPVFTRFRQPPPTTDDATEAKTPVSEAVREPSEAVPQAMAPASGTGSAPGPEAEPKTRPEPEADAEPATAPAVEPGSEDEGDAEAEVRAGSQPDSGPEVPADPEPGPGPEVQANPEPDPRPEVQANPELDPRAEAKPVSESAPHAEPEAVPEPDPRPEDRANPEPDPRPEVQANPEPDPRAEAKPVSESAPHAEPEAVPEPDPRPEDRANPEPDPRPEDQANPEPDPRAEAKPVSESAPHAEPEAVPEPDPRPEDRANPEPDPRPEVQANPEPDPRAEAKPVSESAPHAEPEAVPEPGPESEAEPDTEPGSPMQATPRPTLRARIAHLLAWRARHPTAARVLSWATTALAAVLVLGALLLPNTLYALQPNRFTRIPAEAIIGAVVALALPRRPRIVVAVLYGVGLGALTLVNVLDMGFNEYLGRGFNAALDWGLLDDAQSYLADTMGETLATAAAVGAVVLVLLLMVLMALATVRLSNLLARHRNRATRGALIAGTVWITCSALGLQLLGMPIASDRAAWALKTHARRTMDSLRDEAAFAKEAKADAFGATPGDQLVPDLRGKDVTFAFIESYGRSAIEDPVMAPGVTRTLDTGTEALAKAGFHARSGWLTSATFGGSSWLGHSTFMSGLWLDNQRRYRTVTAGDHLTLTKVFRKTGAWDTVGVMPGVQKGWPEAKWYGLDKMYDARDLGYRGPKFSWSTMPDQYALEAFQRMEHGRKRDKPLMSFVILTSSHQPWAPIPKMVGWDELGDGSVFDAIQKAGKKAEDVITDTAKSREEYGKSIEYSVSSLTQWLERYGTDDTVLVFLGDHQPLTRVSGNHASRDVPVSIVAKDPKVLEKIADWNWTEGLKPAKNAPVWKMSSFRDRFLKAYGSTPHPSKG